jgi:hypothetical protein
MGIPSNSVRECNIEFYPVNWTEDNIGRNIINFKNDTIYYMALFEGYKRSDKWFVDNIINKDNVLEIETLSNPPIITEDEMYLIDTMTTEINKEVQENGYSENEIPSKAKPNIYSLIYEEIVENNKTSDIENVITKIEFNYHS